MSDATRIWLIDDTPLWHEVTKATLHRWGSHHFQGFQRSHSALSALALMPEKQMPHIILMDFYIGGDRGDEVTRQIRRFHPQLQACIVGYSTAHSGSQQIVAAGGNVIVRKHHDQSGINPSLLNWLLGS